MSLLVVETISYATYLFRQKLITQAFLGEKIQTIINKLMRLLLSEISFEKTLHKTFTIIENIPWIKHDTPLAIYLRNNDSLQFTSDNGFFNRLPYQRLNKKKYFFTKIGDEDDVLGVLVTGKSSSETIATESEKIAHLQSIADTLTLLIRRQQKERIIKKQQSQLTQSAKMVALGEMAGGVAHEINTPLAIINGVSFNLRHLHENNLLGEKELTENLDRIDATVSRIADIIHGLRSFSQERKSKKLEKHSLGAIIADTISLCRERFKSYGVQLNIKLMRPEVAIECRKTEITQVLLNLLNNAFDAISKLDRKVISLSIEDTLTEVFIQIQDSGPGIPAETRDRLFEPFFTTKTIGKGTGLGLSISKGIIKRHQGELSLVDPERTTFLIRLPKVQAASQRLRVAG